ncbi:uncharacterized protein BDR25DRAFT_226749 [Lindgomyces ingoldianus]|uniref:Uncharacterized protein n=1 Tax=Lindgomyces ingoldianus TaxID=673940 RepID=A0ACB6QSZ6_9PLEO|nr:uncharacterized protein BDR25DRAFT_226749 [Lindgomyces ingoldianus]KAF2470139.1 hypothetical protein BDR25DRAFT_226749 [Lindgomyces ingoldianus]
MATPPPPHASQPDHILPPPFTHTPLTVLTQGAEALVYRTTFLTPSTPVALKYRPPKPYRHPVLDKRLTKARLLAEARVLVKCRKEGVKVPGVLGGDVENGWLALEWVEGRTVRVVLDEWVERGGENGEGENGEGVGVKEGEEELWDLMRRVGRAVARLHDIGVCHGDLTTTADTVSPQSSPASQPTGHELDGDIIIIDFGLATQTVGEEERAVDLYVLERAFAATHPAAEPLFREVLRVYGESFKGAKVVLKRLEDVRLRGRKRSMLG